MMSSSSPSPASALINTLRPSMVMVCSVIHPPHRVVLLRRLVPDFAPRDPSWWVATFVSRGRPPEHPFPFVLPRDGTELPVIGGPIGSRRFGLQRIVRSGRSQERYVSFPECRRVLLLSFNETAPPQ